MNSDEIRTGLGDLFVKKVIENTDYEYCNRSKAEAAAKLADSHAERFGEWLINSSVKNTDLPMSVKLKMYKSQRGLS